MKSQEIFPIEQRLSDGYAVGFGKFAYYGLVITLKKYHTALVMAERELKRRSGGDLTSKLPVEKRIKGGNYKGDYTKKIYYKRIVRYLGKYHKALTATEKRIEKMKTKSTKKSKR